VAERQGQLMVEMVQAAVREVDLSPEQASASKAALARQARELTASALTLHYRAAPLTSPFLKYVLDFMLARSLGAHRRRGRSNPDPQELQRCPPR
jgi:hypothetical protein